MLHEEDIFFAGGCYGSWGWCYAPTG